MKQELLDFLTSNNRGKYKLSPDDALIEIDRLEQDQYQLLIRFYDEGLRGKHLRKPITLLIKGFIKKIILCDKNIAQLQILLSTIPDILNFYFVKDLYILLIFAQNILLIDTLKLSDLQKLQFLEIVLLEDSIFANRILEHLLASAHEEIFFRHQKHSLNSFLIQQIATTEDNAYLKERLAKIEHRQQTIIQYNAKHAMFGWTMPHIGIADKQTEDEQIAIPFDELITTIATLLPENLKFCIQQIQIKLHAEDIASPSLPITKNELILKLLHNLLKAILHYQQTYPDAQNRRYLNWEEEFEAIGEMCLEGKITAFNNLIFSLETPLVAYINQLLNTPAVSMLEETLAIPRSMQVHYPQAVVCAFLGIHQPLNHEDPYAYNLSLSKLKTLAAQISCAFDRTSFIMSVTPDIPDYFIKNQGMLVNVNSLDYRNQLSLFINSIKRYDLYTQLGFEDSNRDVVNGSYFLGQVDDIATFENALHNSEEELNIRIKNNLRNELASKAEQLLVSNGRLASESHLNQVIARIKFLLLNPNEIHLQEDLWIEVLTKLNGVKIIIDILVNMNVLSFQQLTMDAFIYKPVGINTNLITLILSNPWHAEDVLSLKFVTEKYGREHKYKLDFRFVHYGSEDLNTPDILTKRELFVHLAKYDALKMQAFLEEFYTQPGSLHFALLYFKDRDMIAQLIEHLRVYEELFRTKDCFMAVVGDCLIHSFQNQKHKVFALMKTFLDERLARLLEHNLLTAYFRTISMMPCQIISDFPHNKPDFFTCERTTYILQNSDSINSYLKNIGDKFHKLLQAAQFKEPTNSPLASLSVFSQADNNLSAEQSTYPALQ